MGRQVAAHSKIVWRMGIGKAAPQQGLPLTPLKAISEKRPLKACPESVPESAL